MKNLGRPVKRLLTYNKATELFEPHRDDILLAIQRGLTTYQQIPPAMRAQFRSRTAANVLNDFIVQDAVRRFGEQEPQIVINEDHEGTLFIFDQVASVRFKKVTRKLKPSNIATDRQLKIQYQCEIEGAPRCTQVTVGYTMDEAFAQVGTVHIVCWYGERIHWAIPFSDTIEPFLFSLGRKGQQKRTQGPTVRSLAEKRKKGG